MSDSVSSREIGASWRAFITVPASQLDDFSPLFSGLGAVESLFECGESRPGVMMWRIEGLFSAPPVAEVLAARARRADVCWPWMRFESAIHVRFAAFRGIKPQCWTWAAGRAFSL